MSIWKPLPVLLLFTLIAGACTSVAPGTPPAGDAGAPVAEQSATEQPVTEQPVTEQAATATMDHSSMNMDPSEPFDAQFIDSMIEHHQGAITMAEQVLTDADHEELKAMARTIIEAQAAEIEEMQAWRAAWYPDLPTTGGMGMSMGDMSIGADESMPFDQRFITAMISHHQGAIEMAQMAQHMSEREEIKALADAIISAQEAEIAQMQLWLETWFQ